MKSFELDDIRFVLFQELSWEDALSVLRARNSDLVRSFMFNDGPISEEEHFRFIESLKGDDSRFYWAAFEGSLLGVISLVEVDLHHLRAYLGIYAAPGAPKGSGHRLMEGIRHAAFLMLGLNAVRAQVLENNERAIRLYERCGFSFEGRLREYVRRGESYLDVLVYSLLRRETFF